MKNRVIWACLLGGQLEPLWIEPDSVADAEFDKLGRLPIAPEFGQDLDELPVPGVLFACDMYIQSRPGRRLGPWTGEPGELTTEDWARIGHRPLSGMPATRVGQAEPERES